MKSEPSFIASEFDITSNYNCSKPMSNDVAPEVNILYIVMEILVAIFGVLGNSLVIIVFCTTRKLRRRTNFYIISLAFADFLAASIGIPAAILISVGIPHNCNMCLLMISSLLSFFTISIFSLVLVSCDRFMSIIFPLKYCEEKKNHIIFEIVGCWLLGFFIGFLPYIWHKKLPVNRCLYQNVITEGLQLFRFIVVIIIPMLIIFVIYAMIYRVVLHQLKHENFLKKSFCCSSKSLDAHSSTSISTKRDIKVTLNVFTIVLFFMICWLPLNILKSIKILCTSCTIPDDFITYSIILTHFNSAINPLLYAYHLKDFRQSIVKLFGCFSRESATI